MAESSKRKSGKETTMKASDLTFEPCILGKAKVWMPVDLIEDPSIFQSVVSQDTLDNVLTDADREKLMKLMPTFPEDDEEEKKETLRRLFEDENFKFGNPLTTFRERLTAGFMNPEIAELEHSLQKATYEDYKYAQQRRLHRLLKEVLISRQELLEAAMFTSPSAPVPVKRRLYRNDKAVDGVVDKKYRKLLASSKDDDSTPDSSEEEDNRMEMNGFHASPEKEKSWDALLHPKWIDFWPHEFDLQEDARTHSTFDPKPSQGEGNTPTSKMSSPSKPTSPVRLTQQQYIKLIEDYQDRVEDEHLRNHPELNTKNITLSGIISRAFSVPAPSPQQVPGVVPEAEEEPQKQGKKRKDKERDKKKRKKKKVAAAVFAPPKSTTPVSMGSLEGNSPVDIMSTPESRHSMTDQSLSPATCSPASAGSSSSDIKPPLRVHPSFFSLIRDIFSAAPNHRLPISKLKESLANWQRSPMSLLTAWAILQPSWAKVVDGAMHFLNGEIEVTPEVVPRIRYDEERHMWQWISELPPDSEEELVTLFKQWLDTLPGMRAVPAKSEETSTTPTTSQAITSPTPVPQPTIEELKRSFAEQECERYSQPQRAYIYQMSGYQSTVGPVKGVFGKEMTLNKAREHALLVSDRPSYVTILSLVRDAVARLPSGEGTRSVVCELLKDSQYLADSSDSQINNVVSGALDRLHYEKDPCIKYDVNRKLWIYLHKDRTKEEFERLHQEQAAEAKARKSIARQTKLLPKIMPGIRDSPTSLQTSRPGSALSDTSSESLSIEVCSPKASPGRASSPKVSRKSPAFAKSASVPGFQGIGEGLIPNLGSSFGRGGQRDAVNLKPETMVPNTSRAIPRNVLGQPPFVISPHKVGSLQSALRELHQTASPLSAATDSFIKAQLLGAKASQIAGDAFGGLFAPMHQAVPGGATHGITSQATPERLTDQMQDGRFQSQIRPGGHVPKVMKSMSVPCTLPDGQVVMLTPELVAKTKKRARSGSGGRKRAGTPQGGDIAVSMSGLVEQGSGTSSTVVTPSSVTVSHGAAKSSKKASNVSPGPVGVGANKLATVSEALALKRAEAAALQSGKQQAGRTPTITLPPGALKGQTVKSILASVGIPMTGASVTVSRIDSPGSPMPGKQSSAKTKDNRKSPVFSGVSIIGNQQAQKGRPSSAPMVSGKKSPISSMPQGFSHQTIGLTTVNKGGQIVVQPVALGLERPGSSASPGVSRASGSQQGLTLKAIPVSLSKQHMVQGVTGKDLPGARNMGHSEAEAGRAALDAPDGANKRKTPKASSSKHPFFASNAAAALVQAGKMTGAGDLKDFASLPLSVLFPGSRQAGGGGSQKGGLPVLTSPFIGGGQIPLASLTDGKGLIFQMPPGSNIMPMPVTTVPSTLPRSEASVSISSSHSQSGPVPSKSTPRRRPPTSGITPQSVQMQMSSAASSQGSAPMSSKQQRIKPPQLPPNIVAATIRSALAAQSRANPAQSRANPAQLRANPAQSRANPAHQQLRMPFTQATSAGHPSSQGMAFSASAAMKLGAQNAAAGASQSPNPHTTHKKTPIRNLVSSPTPAQVAQAAQLQQARAHATLAEAKTSLTASSIASIIANLKQNPMASISIPSVVSAPAMPTTSFGQTPPQVSPSSSPSSIHVPVKTQKQPSSVPRTSGTPPSNTNVQQMQSVTESKKTQQPAMNQSKRLLQTSATLSSAAATVAMLQAKMAQEARNLPATTGAATSESAPAPTGTTPQRVIPPFEPRVTRGKTKGKDKDKTPKKDPS